MTQLAVTSRLCWLFPAEFILFLKPRQLLDRCSQVDVTFTGLRLWSVFTSLLSQAAVNTAINPPTPVTRPADGSRQGEGGAGGALTTC